MKKPLAAIAVACLLGVLIAWAQSGSSISFSASGTCAPPAPNVTSICGTTSNVLLSLNGAPYAGLQGAPGPAGPLVPWDQTSSNTRSRSIYNIRIEEHQRCCRPNLKTFEPAVPTNLQRECLIWK